MATITDTYLEVHLGTTAAGTLVGQQIHKSGEQATIDLDDTELGVDLNPGTRYCAIAKCINSDNYDSGWTQPYPFQTLILAQITNIDVFCGGTFGVTGTLTYDTNDSVVQIAHLGVRYSVNSDGSNYVQTPDENEQDFTGQGIQVGNNLTENTTYYFVPVVTDQLGQTYVGSWTYATQATTLYNAPTITNLSTTHTYNSIGGSVTLNSSDTLKASGCYVTIQASGGGTIYKKMLSTTKGTAQSFSFVDGGTDDNGNTITITSATTYNVLVFAENNQANGCDHRESTSVTTDQQTPASISLTVTDITPYSAVANLIYS